MRAWFLVWACLIAGGTNAAFGQSARPPQVGAADIFKALTQPDRPGEIAVLKALQAQLGDSPDAARLEAVRARLEAIVKEEAARHGDLPQALVMSQIASRIEAAMEAVEASRAAEQASLAGRLRPFAVPALMLVSGALAAGLAASLLTLWARRDQSQESTEEIRELLAKIRRRMDTLSHAAPEHSTGGMAEAADDAAARLRDVVRSVEAKLLAAFDGPRAAQPDASAGTTEMAVVQGARIDALAKCLEAVGGEIGRLEDAAARLERLADVQSIDRSQIAADTQSQALGAQPGDEESVSSIELLSELAHAANGQCARLDSLIAEAHAAVRTLSDSAYQAAAREDLRPVPSDEAALADASAALRDAAAESVRQSASAIADLHASIGQVTNRIGAASAMLSETAARLGQASQAALDGTIDLRNETRRLTTQASAAQVTFLNAARTAEEALRQAADHLALHVQGAPDAIGGEDPTAREADSLRAAIDTAQAAARRVQQGAFGQEQAVCRASDPARDLALLPQRGLAQAPQDAFRLILPRETDTDAA